MQLSWVALTNSTPHRCVKVTCISDLVGPGSHQLGIKKNPLNPNRQLIHHWCCNRYHWQSDLDHTHWSHFSRTGKKPCHNSCTERLERNILLSSCWCQMMLKLNTLLMDFFSSFYMTVLIFYSLLDNHKGFTMQLTLKSN